MSVKSRKPVIAVCGAGSADDELSQKAEAVGRAIASAGAVLICGGLSGVMEAAARGAKEAGGTTIGILPGFEKDDANAFIDISVATGMGQARNAIIVTTADAVVAVGGEFGTLSEIAFALKMGKPVVSVGSWEISEKIIREDDPEKAVLKALSMIS